MNILGHFFSTLGQTFSRAFNAFILRGSPAQSVSSRAYQMSFESDGWDRCRWWIDLILSPRRRDHCEAAWNFEVDSALATLEKNGLIRPTMKSEASVLIAN